MDWCPVQGELCSQLLALQKLGISTGLMGHKAQVQLYLTLPSWATVQDFHWSSQGGMRVDSWGQCLTCDLRMMSMEVKILNTLMFVSLAEYVSCNINQKQYTGTKGFYLCRRGFVQAVIYYPIRSNGICLTWNKRFFNKLFNIPYHFFSNWHTF